MTRKDEKHGHIIVGFLIAACYGRYLSVTWLFFGASEGSEARAPEASLASSGCGSGAYGFRGIGAVSGLDRPAQYDSLYTGGWSSRIFQGR